MAHLLLQTVGRTPLVELKRLNPKPGVRLFAKLEGQNPSGSIKDRVAMAMVDELEQTHGLRPGATLVEASTGNTAIALAMVARQRGYELKVVIPQGVVASIADILQLYGVEILWVRPKAGMCTTGPPGRRSPAPCRAWTCSSPESARAGP
jgi:cysteine synthase B